jgi:periplasmic divalent cation tolerance protein
MHIVILVTAANKQEAEKISRGLLEDKLVACVNIVEKIDSLFWWQGKIDQSAESLLVIKSKKAKFAKIVKLVKSLHSYAVPEIIALPIVSADQAYLRWMDGILR